MQMPTRVRTRATVFPTPLPELYPSSAYNMGDQSRSSRFQAIFDSSLNDYERQTGITLAEHPLAKQLQTCQSVESITVLLQEQARAFSEFRKSDKCDPLFPEHSSKICQEFLERRRLMQYKQVLLDINDDKATGLRGICVWLRFWARL